VLQLQFITSNGRNHMIECTRLARYVNETQTHEQKIKRFFVKHVLQDDALIT